MTDADLDWLEEQHADDNGYCVPCGYMQQPCHVRALIEEVRRLRASRQHWIEQTVHYWQHSKKPPLP